MQAKRLLLMILPLAFARTLPAQRVSSHTMVYAVYQGEATAGVVLRSMRKAQHAAGERIESYALVSRAPDGRIAVQERPVAPNPAIEVMLGTLGEPSGAAAGASAIDDDAVDSLRASLTPGTSAVIAVLDDRWVKDVQRELQADRARTMMFGRITIGAPGAGTE
jgi:hypothetical protein